MCDGAEIKGMCWGRCSLRRMGDSMNISLPSLALDRVLQSDAAEILAAREKARIIHGTRDIDSAGDEVEQAVRLVLRRKLPVSYYVGHGHIVDSKAVTTREHDIIITDNFDVPVLFRALDGTEYFPHESVYAVGEVKSGYYNNQNPIDGFVEANQRIREQLVREKTPPTWVSLGRSQGFHFDSPVDASRPYRNPLFSFMIFANSNGFSLDDLSKLYNSSFKEDLPNVICFLDRRVVVRQRLHRQDTGQLVPGAMHVIPEFVVEDADAIEKWVLVRFEAIKEDAAMEGHNFGLLYYLLLAHLSSCVLKQPDMLSYFRSLFPPIRSDVLT